MKCCFTSYVYGIYQDYIPIFIYSVACSFPQHVTKIFLKEKLSDKNKESLELVRKFCDNFEVIENFSGLEHCELPHGAANRYLLTREYFDDCEYVYICDIDFIIYNKYNNNFIDTYLRKCRIHNLPFSNYWRYDGRFRMGGIHFIIKNEYFDIIDKHIEEMKDKNCEFRAKYIGNPIKSYDEEMLYYMLFKAFNFKDLNEKDNKIFNGLHLKTFRSSKTYDYDKSFYGSQTIRRIFTVDLINLCMRTDEKFKLYKLLHAVGATIV